MRWQSSIAQRLDASLVIYRRRQRWNCRRIVERDVVVVIRVEFLEFFKQFWFVELQLVELIEVIELVITVFIQFVIVEVVEFVQVIELVEQELIEFEELIVKFVVDRGRIAATSRPSCLERYRQLEKLFRVAIPDCLTSQTEAIGMNVRAAFLFCAAAGLAVATTACSGEGRSPVTAPSGLSATSDDASPATTASSSGSSRTIRVRCERRSGRSKASVDGNNLAAGQYRATIMSGSNSATTGLRAAVSQEVEFDFDSNPNDIAAGATRISSTFIQGGRLTGQIKNAAGTVVLSSTVTCEVR